MILTDIFFLTKTSIWSKLSRNRIIEGEENLLDLTTHTLICRFPCRRQSLRRMEGSLLLPWSRIHSRVQIQWHWRKWRLHLHQKLPSSKFGTREDPRRTWFGTWCGRRSLPNPQTSKPQRWRKTPCKIVCIGLGPFSLKLSAQGLNWWSGRSNRFTYQQVMNRITAQALEPPGFNDLPQQKHRLAPIMRAWLAMRSRKAPTP